MDETRLKLLKLDLQISTSAIDDLLQQMLDAACGMIEREGVSLDLSSPEDTQLVVMYAAYLYRKRRDDNPTMPRMLRFALNNRLFGQKAREPNADS